ncbi:MAG: hypothetical protein ACF8TS_05225, partial [Maioricimonas sp. JB049]
MHLAPAAWSSSAHSSDRTAGNRRQRRPTNHERIRMGARQRLNSLYLAAILVFSAIIGRAN